MEFFGVDMVEAIKTIGYVGVFGIVFAETGLFLGDSRRQRRQGRLSGDKVGPGKETGLSIERWGFDKIYSILSNPMHTHILTHNHTTHYNLSHTHRH